MDLFDIFRTSLAVALGATLGGVLVYLRQRRGHAERAEASNAHRRSASVEHAVQVVHDVFTAIGDAAARIQQFDGRLEDVLSVRKQADQPSVATPQQEAAISQTLADQHELFVYLRGACEMIQQNAQCIESYVGDALIDPLTGVANRRAFDYELNRRFSEWNRQRTPLSLLMVDIDHFKQINDRHGHLFGDEVLRCLAELLCTTLRGTDQTTRYGGEEFCVILPNTKEADARNVASLLLQCIAEHTFDVKGESVALTTSIGVATALIGDDEQSLVHRSDLALYAAKRGGRNCVFSHNGLDCEVVERQTNAAAEEARRMLHLKGQRDPVTGLHDAAMFYEYLKCRIAEHVRYGTRFSMMLVTIDGFQDLVDASVQQGEAALKTVSRYLTAALRAADVVARLEQDRFVAILPATSVEDVLYPAERLRRAVAALDRIVLDERTVRLTVSVGAAEVHENDACETVLLRVEQACQAAQTAGGNVIYGQDEGMCLELDALSLLPELVDV